MRGEKHTLVSKESRWMRGRVWVVATETGHRHGNELAELIRAKERAGVHQVADTAHQRFREGGGMNRDGRNGSPEMHLRVVLRMSKEGGMGRIDIEQLRFRHWPNRIGSSKLNILSFWCHFAPLAPPYETVCVSRLSELFSWAAALSNDAAVHPRSSKYLRNVFRTTINRRKLAPLVSPSGWETNWNRDDKATGFTPTRAGSETERRSWDSEPPEVDQPQTGH